MTAEEYLALQSGRTHEWLERFVPREDEQPERLHRAMRYSLFAGGKRLRPALCIAGGELVGAAEELVMPVACALEMIHTYSLIHDDLPAMDDDDLRRGRPTCHRAFDEATAILAGDSLLTLAFRVLAEHSAIGDRQVAVIREIARAAGTPDGMAAGQALDLASEGASISGDDLDRVHASKTGSLLTASVVSGALAGGADDSLVARLRQYGAAVGLAFQIADDVLDVTSTSAELGKTPGKDDASRKATYPSLYGVEASLERARSLVRHALGVLEPIGTQADPLRAMACFVVDRRK